MTRAGDGKSWASNARAREERAAGVDEEAGEASLQAVNLSPELRQRIVAYGREESLADEIGALRAVLAQLLATGGEDTQALSQSVPRVVNAIVRALRTQRVLTGESTGDLHEIATRILAEIGWGE